MKTITNDDFDHPRPLCKSQIIGGALAVIIMLALICGIVTWAYLPFLAR